MGILRPNNPPAAFDSWTFEPGCYVDAARGIYAIDYIVSRAEAFGFVPSNCDCEYCKGPDSDGYAGCEFTGEVEDEVDQFMNNRFSIDGHHWGRNENGDWGLWQERSPL
jgi:hypothetical protein